MMYRNYLDASEPIYFIIIYIVSNFIDKNIFMSLINGIFVYFISRYSSSLRINKFFILSLIFNFYFLALFFSLERLKFSLLFFVLFLYYFPIRRKKTLFLTLSILSHTQTIILFISAYINSFIKSVVRTFKNLRIKKSPYFIIGISILFLATIFLKDHIFRKVNAYISAGLDIANIIKPAFFMFLTFLIYKKDFSKIFFMFLPIILSSFILGESRLVILSYFLFLYLSFKRSPRINIYILTTSVYFIYRGFIFLNNILQYGNGYINF